MGLSSSDLRRFTLAQEKVYNNVLSELTNGKKESHWMWYIFPQIVGLGASETAQYYSIKTQAEAFHYLHHPVLGKRLYECTKIVMSIKERSASEIFGFPDDLKLKSSMTLFAYMSEQNSIFVQMLRHYFHGELDNKTLEILGS